MPYIAQSLRDYIHSGELRPSSPGELNYHLTSILIHGSDKRSQIAEAVQAYVFKRNFNSLVNYDLINEVIGALACCGCELARRRPEMLEESDILVSVTSEWYLNFAAPYEDAKIIENGDVYG